ncbi:MAG: KpsF/GutQ family sugar-phosphate isomerase [Candidatus Hydrothermales bacterium]
MDKENIIKRAKDVLRLEAEGIKRIINLLDVEFARAVELILNTKGKLIVTGLGKSGIVGKKIAATFTSTGTPAMYLHPSESLHGDLGVVSETDTAFFISKSGQTEELQILLPFFKRKNIPIISLTANRESDLAKDSDVVLYVPVDKEACPYDLAPTVSTTVFLAIGDALAIVVMEQKSFKAEDFAALHPGGVIGKRFWLKVKDMMVKDKDVPIVHKDSPMKDVIIEMTQKRGITSVVDDDGKVVGVITDGDLRRLLEKSWEKIFTYRAHEIMTTNPKIIGPNALAYTAARKMEEYKITALIVVDEENKPIGVIHLHDLMKANVI